MEAIWPVDGLFLLVYRVGRRIRERIRSGEGERERERERSEPARKIRACPSVRPPPSLPSPPLSVHRAARVSVTTSDARNAHQFGTVRFTRCRANYYMN